MSKSFQLSLAPEKLWQAINPWTFYQQGAQLGFINIDLGQTPHPEVEQAVHEYVGSYGRQLGRIGDALEVLLNHVKFDRGREGFEPSPPSEPCVRFSRTRLSSRWFPHRECLACSKAVRRVNSP